MYNLQYGIIDWNRQKLPIIVSPNAKPVTKNRLNPEEFSKLIGSDNLVFVDFYTPWCAPCRKMMPMIDDLKREYKDKISIVKINADAGKELVREQNIRGVPYLILYKNGKNVFTHNGLISREKLVDTFNSNLGKANN